MIVGPFLNSSAIFLGAIGGAALARRLPQRLCATLPQIFGLCAMAMSVVLIQKVAHLPVMVLSVILGTIVGELVYLERGIGTVAGLAKRLVERVTPAPSGMSQAQFLEKFVAITVLFCASGIGVFGSMQEGMTGDATLLITKSFLDFFTAAIFATGLGYAVAVIALPQLAIQLCLAAAAVLILPLVTPAMQADFSATGGALLLATGFRICGLQAFPVANMLPALALAMPLSALWSRLLG
ncbi:DUF554 domain-containing protein [Ideonella sp. B7]|uniref:DUF554 domain-containing protein n=1 Tax=Ideonella benzenivorans TaxID=2831643 RepID=UPI001CED56E0|nr:DUF554 domain-containing protein [Ideonella benzenivorans]MCA6218423.1 DUF554 domain-containing protein [Ideonella benzenivorans]